MAEPSPVHTGHWRVFQALSAFLIFNFVWAVMVPGGEWPVPPYHYLTMALDVGLLIALVIVRGGTVGSMAPDDPRRGTGQSLFWTAAICSILLLAIRFTSEAAWWTGHLQNEAGA